MESPELIAIKKLTLANVKIAYFISHNLVEVHAILQTLLGFERARTLQGGRFDPAEFDREMKETVDKFRTQIKQG